MMARAYVTVWIVAWMCWSAAIIVGAKVMKCCPRDMILAIDTFSCTGFVTNDQNQRESYAWSSSDDSAAATIPEDFALSVSNSSSIPWWIPPYMEFLQSSNLSDKFEPDDGSFDVDGTMPCEMASREMTVIDDDVAVLDDGRLVMFGQENRSAGAYERLTFTSTEYCIDRVSLVDGITPNNNNSHKTTTSTTTTAATTTVRDGSRLGNSSTAAPETHVTYTYVALVCRPCTRMTCVPKCCGKGLMLVYQKHNKSDVIGCRKMQSVDNATAAIQMKLANGTELRRKDLYFFGLKPPNCGSRGWYLLGADTKNGSEDAKKQETGIPKKQAGYGLLPDGRVQVDGGLLPIERDDYCVDAMQAGTKTSPPTYTGVMLACRLAAGVADAAGPLKFREILYGTYFVVGTIFLAATLLIYAVLPELRVTVHSGNLMAHTVCLFVSYATLAATTLVRRMFNNCACVIAGFVIQFSFLAAFFWLNVMCADIAWTFSGFRLLLSSNKIENEKKKYVIYSAYAWGCSIGITILTALAEFTKLFGDSSYKPNFGNYDCWFSNKLSVGVFFYLPIGLLLSTNFILFLFTAFRIVFIRRGTSKVLNRQNNHNDMRLSLYLKLFCLMGVTFVFEVISWAVEAPAYYWYATDAINSLRGVFVFFIFCWKRSVLNLLLARAPEPARERFVRAFGVREPHRYPSFSSSCQPNNFGTAVNTSTRTHSSATASAQTANGLQLSQFGSSASFAASAARRNSSGRR
ncbi:probable G-protein coupled receptor Mth-like 1 [Metopolophium dirhodum]|uniref:probable G-protein coupled receptor Mth-like 1 n=1 Tax=Metopolophium dirhodum TaxID=44670 RepID=UPI00298FDDF7|nr:probable G-protein coupled receptor Mth-like 1 [Metopolophium dirhodum]XP_060865829.1 probable G-protein coupled receptor Mth-like 1 [Metopolophium dirhodum]